MSEVIYDEVGYVGIDNGECGCTHVWLRTHGFSESDINGHANSCLLNFVSIIPTNNKEGDKQ